MQVMFPVSFRELLVLYMERVREKEPRRNNIRMEMPGGYLVLSTGSDGGYMDMRECYLA